VNGLQQVIYDVSQVLLWPVLISALACLLWVLIELGFFLYELYLRFRYRDLDALEARTLRARRAFRDGKPRTAYRYLQENNYSIVVARFLFDLIRNYQTERLAAKPLKLLQEYEFYTVKRLERTRILVRVGPILGLMGTLIPLSPALLGLASGNTTQLAENLTTAFSVTVVGLLIGGIAFGISIVRDRLYSQDISDMEYLLELLEGGDERLQSGRRRNKKGIWDADLVVEYESLCDRVDRGQPTFLDPYAEEDEVAGALVALHDLMGDAHQAAIHGFLV
jgi:biopolymer transport protein ExbB/TolQ